MSYKLASTPFTLGAAFIWYTMMRSFLLLLVSVLCVKTHAQLVQENLSSTLPDSFNYQLAGDIYASHLSYLDSIDALYHHYDPVRRRAFDAMHLGNLGSPHRDGLFIPKMQLGMDFGMSQFDLYKHKPEDVEFYDSDFALSDLDYSQGAPQDASILRARFRRSFTDGVKFSLDYQRINQTGEFANQRAKHTAFGIGVLYDAPAGKYTGMFIYESNSIVQEDNGGVVDYDLLDSTNLPLSEPDNVYLLTAETVNRSRLFQWDNHFHVVRQKDTTERGSDFDIITSSEYSTEYYRFSDEQPDAEEGYYDGFQTDARGIRNFLFARTFGNTLSIQFRGLNRGEQTGQALRLMTGITHKFIRVDQEPETEELQETYLNGKVVFRWKEAFKLEATARLGLFDARNNYLVKGSLEYKHPALGMFCADAYLFQRQPWLIERKLFVSQQPVWQIDPENPNYQGIGLQWKIPDWKLTLSGRLQLIDNHIVYLEDKLPEQITDPEVIFTLSLQNTIRLGHFGLVNRAYIQQSDNDKLALPEWMYKGQLFYTGWWFKRSLKVRIGVDYRVFSAFTSVAYFPVTGQFHITGMGDIASYHALDAFLSMQINKFRAFVKVENLTSFWNNDVYYFAEGYPQFEGYFRFGLNMRLYD